MVLDHLGEYRSVYAAPGDRPQRRRGYGVARRWLLQAQVDAAQRLGVTSAEQQPDITDEQALFLSDAVPTGFMGADFCDISPGATVAVWAPSASD